MMRSIYKKQNNKGFTLMETLVVVAILVILISVSIVSVVTIQRDIRQKELDGKAEAIYAAAQYRLTQLRAAGNADIYSAGAEGTRPLGYIPLDAEPDSQITAGTLYYIVNSKTFLSAATAVFPSSSMDSSLWGNQWLIEYNPDNGSIYGVFYCEDAGFDLSKEATLNEQNSSALDKLRRRTSRLTAGAKVGYYGGDVTLIGATDTLMPWINLQNGEELSAKFYCSAPQNTAVQNLMFTITFIDSRGNQKVIKTTELIQENKTTYSYSMTLDSLDPGQDFYTVMEGALSPGLDFYVVFEASCSNEDVDNRTVGRHSEYTTNSLFAYDKDTSDNTALIQTGRHLQNLDKITSHVVNSVTKAEQISDISFQDDATNDLDWYSVYADRPFTPISNDSLSRYEATGASIFGLHIADQGTQNAGLFREMSGYISGVTLTGVRIDGGNNVGALVGQVSAPLTITNCRTYLSKSRNELPEAVNDIKDITPWIYGKYVGGLVGYSHKDLTIENSFASVILKAETVAGGLVGQAASGTLTISTSYADCYLFGKYTGGLLGENVGASVALENFYAVGYQVAQENAAGILLGEAHTATNGYAAVEFVEPNQNMYSTFTSCATATKVYYLKNLSSADGKYIHCSNTVDKTYSELCNSYNDLGSKFASGNMGTTYAYNLLQQGLTDYSYPRLVDLLHFGDWQADFENGALVYYEYYGSENYGFYGANADTLRANSVALGDGYALAFASDPRDITITLNRGEVKKTVSINQNGTTYYLVLLSIDRDAGTNFYQQLTVTQTSGTSTHQNSFWLNPDFAKTVITSTEAPAVPEFIYIRTARHLYNLSQHYTTYSALTKDSFFRQELDIDYATYEWKDFAGTTDLVTVQSPIQSFQATYNGLYHSILGLSIRDDSTQLGLFGSVENGALVENVFLLGDGSSVQHKNAGYATGSKKSTSLGVVAGINYGTIRNCSVSDYQIVYNAYKNNVANVGGLVGRNVGVITDSVVALDSISLVGVNATMYTGGLAGRNQGVISNGYAIGCIQVKDATKSTVSIAGFVAQNNGGVVRRSYSATALVASGDATSQGFGFAGGTYSQCYYLNGESFEYKGQLYNYNYTDNKVGQAITAEELQNITLSGFGSVAGDTTYPYPAIIKNAKGEYIHFGAWPVQHDMGTLGVFYWEYEEGGSNSGYHFSYTGTREGETFSGSSLCTAHDDGGVITSFGYGYFYKENEGKPALTVQNCNLGNENKEAAAAMASQLAGYSFVAYETGDSADKLYLTGENANSTWTLLFGSGTNTFTYQYSVCPFFANAISLDSNHGNTTNSGKPGTEGNTYEIRSVAQLQFINWNNKKMNTSSYIVQTQGTGTENVIYDRFTFLSYGKPETTPSANLNLFWKQSHDINASKEGFGNFTPIGSMYDDAGNTGVAKAVMAFFSSSFDGQSYAIKNVRIETTAQCVGLFGVTAGAKMKNIIMYSDDGAEIIHNDSGSWYSVGGLVGLAGDRNMDDSTFTNCTVSGYTIRDNQSSEPGWGGGSVGGLVGATTMNLTNCSAVSNIEINISYNQGYKNLRVGGLVGCCRGSIQNCYAGGKMQNLSKITHGHYSTSANIWMGGILGGIVLRNGGNLATLIGDTTVATTVSNCYSFVEMSTNGKNGVKSIQSIASNGEMQEKWNFSDVYNDYIVIKNCYVLESCAVGCDDYNEIKGAYNFNGLNINAKNKQSERRIELVNSRSPYMSYEEMSNGTLGKMLSDFSTVTTTEHGANINGKYSFPGTDKTLQGLNYPFPTILTQVNAFGDTVNIHYGAWPYASLYWEESSTSVDLLTHGGSTSMNIYCTGVLPNYQILDEDGKDISDTSQLIVSFGTYQNGYYPVTITASAVGHYTLRVTKENLSADLDIAVTANLFADTDSSDISVAPKEDKNLIFHVRDNDGSLLTAPGSLTWTIHINNGESQQDIVECDITKITYDKATGQLTVPITGFSVGEATVTVTLCFTYGSTESGEPVYTEQSISLIVITKSAD